MFVYFERTDNCTIWLLSYAAKRAGFDIHPYFLQDEQGKPYPAMASIAQRFLQSGHGVWLMSRDCKHYCKTLCQKTEFQRAIAVFHR